MSSHHCEHQAQQNQSGAGKMILATFAKAGVVTAVTADLCDWSFNQRLIYNNPATLAPNNPATLAPNNPVTLAHIHQSIYHNSVHMPPIFFTRDLPQPAR